MEQSANLSQLQSNSLPNNYIKQFILRIDIKGDFSSQAFELINDICAKHYSRRSELNKVDYIVEIDKNGKNIITPQIGEHIAFEKDSPKTTFNLIKQKDASTLDMTSSSYINKDLYKSIIDQICSELIEKQVNIDSTRIGMRYINLFPNNSISNIRKIINNRGASVLKNIYTGNSNSRIVVIEENVSEIEKLKVQYGFFNEFYPSKMKNFNIYLDIDSSTSAITNVSDWQNTISRLNHKAYQYFIDFVNPQFINKMK